MTILFLPPYILHFPLAKSIFKTNDYVVYNTTTGEADAETVAGTT